MRADDAEKVNNQRRARLLSRGGRRGRRPGLAIGREVVTRSFTPQQIGRSRLGSRRLKQRQQFPIWWTIARASQ
jgi:hypothetical protein